MSEVGHITAVVVHEWIHLKQNTLALQDTNYTRDGKTQERKAERGEGGDTKRDPSTKHR